MKEEAVPTGRLAYKLPVIEEKELPLMDRPESSDPDNASEE